MQSLRHQRVRELLKREIGEIIRREIPTGEAGLITVNDVGLAGDLQSATVFVGIVGTSEQQRKGLEILKKDRRPRPARSSWRRTGAPRRSCSCRLPRAD